MSEKRLNSDEEVKTTVKDYMEKEVGGKLYDTGMQKLPDRLQNNFDMNGDYVKK